MMCSYWRRYVLDSTLTRLCHSKYISFRMINFRLVNNTASSQGNGFWSAPLFIAKRSRNSWLWKMTIVLYTTKRHFLHEYNLTLWLLRNNLFKCIFNIFLLIHSFIPFFRLRTYFQLFLYPLHCLHWLHFTLHHFCKYLTIYITSWAFRRERKDKWMKKRVLGEISYSGNKKKEKRFIHNNFWLVAF